MFHGETIPNVNENSTRATVISTHVKSKGNRRPTQVQHIRILYRCPFISVEQRKIISEEMRTSDQARPGAFSRRLGGNRLGILICQD